MSDVTLRSFRAARTLSAFRARNLIADDSCLPCEQEQQAAAIVAAGKDILLHGLAVPYDTPTGDGRGVRKGALTYEADGQSVPLIWDRQDGDHVRGFVDISLVEMNGKTQTTYSNYLDCRYATEVTVQDLQSEKAVENIKENYLRPYKEYAEKTWK